MTRQHEPIGEHAVGKAKPQNIERARELYGDDDVQIDDNATEAWAEDGVWVQAWVWLSDENGGYAS